MKTIWKKEVYVYLHSLSGYVFLSVFLFVFGIYFAFNNLQSASRELSGSLQNMPLFLLFLTPVLTMSALAGERRGRTLSLLFSSPIGIIDIIAGKYLAMLSILTAGMVPLVLYALLLTVYGGSFGPAQILGLGGFFLMCAAFFAIGLFASAVTDHPIIAAVLTYVILFFFVYAESMAALTRVRPLQTILRFVSFSGRYRYFLMGILDLSDVGFFLSIIVLFLFLAVRSVNLLSISFERDPRCFAMEVLVFGLSGVCFILLNTIMIQIAVRKNLVTDLTYQNLFTLSEESNSFLQELATPVQITCLNSRDEGDPNVNEILDRYAAGSSMLSVEWVSLIEHPELASEYEAKGTPLNAGSLIIRTEAQERILTSTDLYELTSPDGVSVSVTAFQAEQKLTSAIAAVTGDRHNVSILQGHDEEISEGFEHLLTDSCFDLSSVTLSVQDIPENTDLLLMAAPRRDYTPQELEKIDSFLGHGGTLLVFLPPFAELSNLSGFFSEWGITPLWTLIREPELFYQADTNLLPSYAAHIINDYFAHNAVFLVFPQTQAFLTQDVPGHTVSPVLLSTSTAQAGTGSANAPAAAAPAASAAAAPFILAAASEAARTAGSGKLFISGSSAVWDDALLATNAFANREFLVQVLGWALPAAQLFSIPSKSLVSQPLAITDKAALLWTIGSAVLIPLTLLAAGLVIHIRRRKRL